MVTVLLFVTMYRPVVSNVRTLLTFTWSPLRDNLAYNIMRGKEIHQIHFPLSETVMTTESLMSHSASTMPKHGLIPST